MNVGDAILIAAPAVGAIATIGSIIFRMGQHSQRISSLEEKTKDHGAVSTAVAVLTSGMGEMKAQLGEISHDVKNILTGRVTPARRGRDSEG